MFGAAKLTGRFWFRKTWTGKLVLLVEEEKPRWLSRTGLTKRRWRDARLLDLAEAPMHALMTLERGYRGDPASGPARILQSVVPPGTRGAIATPIGTAVNA
ncbi:MULTISPECIES: hypothetical protein [Methylobacterium]|jgi:hypothetical protein|uniref:Uncharacterized protein n=3 Tax=Methylobacterium TaxID=407 RepID=A0AAE8HQL6_9HYPH|nr:MULTISPECIES: hypothetical protein [Methylobacterium]KOX54261.1 hypothetical protein ADL19_14500 [Streptomyces purpurogeneiscleroticus]AIQ93351.1 protein of unassigned function [Methylobacterium oryzae CBMB20]APT33636.1 hypothetical protein MCBMB27_04345 [Methylobacterium phyllosphaerae]AWV15358.1 hypothetical protein A3862_07380 [Methylobacterium sp. XJLW]MBA9061239.1 hypothetical protein [Methylobacterium fujisawaense]